MAEETSQTETARRSGSALLTPDVTHFIYESLEQGDSPRASSHLRRLHAADLAELLNQSTPEQCRQIVTLLKGEFDPETLVDLEPSIREDVLEILGAERSAEAIAELDVDDAVYVIEDLDKEDRQEILEKISDSEVRAELEEGLSYPENSAGRLMHNVVVSVPSDWNVGQTIDHLRSAGELPDDFHEIYVVDKEHRPVGGVSVSRVLRTHRNIPVRAIMRKDLRLIAPYMDQEEVAHLFRKYALVSAPVADEALKLIGVITADDIVDVVDEEAEEDILHLAGVQGESDLHLSAKESAMHRFPWLFFNLLTGVLSASVVSMFADSIAQLVTLAILMPLVASVGGNAGTQAVAVAVRALATKELTSTNASRVIRKEITVGAMNGLMLAVMCAIISFVVFHEWQLSAVFGIAVIANLIVAGTAGALIPMALERMKVDPAVSSGVFLTALTDMLGFFAFLGLATWLLL